ncbi:tyrosine-type recombinase/integrase [Paraliobacillus ryukyuensis]
MKHTSITLLVNQGVHTKVFQEQLGHSKVSTTWIYEKKPHNH